SVDNCDYSVDKRTYSVDKRTYSVDNCATLLTNHLKAVNLWKQERNDVKIQSINLNMARVNREETR
ncbi:MAG: hypothetical protein ABF969_02995, partial [Sporolactobacillus sp.]